MQRPKIPDNMLPGNLSNTDYRYDTFKKRLTEFYKRVKPDHVNKIPSILEKYKNKFELSRKLLKKYPDQWKHVIWHKPQPNMYANLVDIPLQMTTIIDNRVFNFYFFIYMGKCRCLTKPFKRWAFAKADENN